MKKLSIVVLTFIIATALSCTKEQTGEGGSSDQPTSSEFASYTGEASDITTFSAAISGKAKINGGVSPDTKFGILYSESSGILYGSANEVKAETFDSDYNYVVKISGLNNNTTYYFRSYLYLKEKVYYGEIKSFNTLSNADLSANGTANCYIVSAAGGYKFKATVMGNSTQSVGTPSSAEVLWESFGTDMTPSVGDIVKNVSLSDGYVKFTATDNKGNAVIAVKDASGTILWSWHIWLTDKPAEQVYNNNAGTVMDRNLGATSATPGDVHALGLLYQWGRKDPFLSSSSISDGKVAVSTLSWPKGVSSDAINGTIAYAVAHPTTYISYNKGNGDWYYSGTSSTDNTRWQTSDKTKGMYDPCPQGWRVPDGGRNGLWSKAFGSNAAFYDGPWDSTNRGINFGSGNGQSSSHQLGSASTIWYPVAGYRRHDDGALLGVGESCFYWSGTPDDDRAYYFQFNNHGYVYPSSSNYRQRAGGYAVRCLSE